MATGYPDNDNDCEGCHTTTKSNITYRREVHERLCDDCALKRQDCIKGRVNRFKLFCDKHAEEEAKLYCRCHEIPICHICALTAHAEACQKQDIQDVKAEKRDQLKKLSQQGQAEKESIALLEKDSSQHQSHINIHLEMIERQINEKEVEERKKIQKKLNKEKAGINEEADKNIDKINEERRRQLEQVENDAKEIIIEGERNAEALRTELGKIKIIIGKYIVKLQAELQERRNKISHAMEKADDIIDNEERLLHDASDVTNLLKQFIKTMKTKFNLGKISEIKRKTEEIKFKEGKGPEIGRLDGMQEECVLRDAWKHPVGTSVIGSISNHEVMLTRDKSLFVANTKSRTVTPVKGAGKDRVEFSSVAQLDEGRLVIGTRCGSLRIFHRLSSKRDHHDVITWQHLRTIRNKVGSVELLSVDKDGLILAAPLRASTIDVYNPEDGKLVQRVKLREDIKIFGLSSMSSGLVVVLADSGGDHVIYVVDRSSAIKSTIRLGKGWMCDIAIDETDDIYCTYYDNVRRLYVVDVLSPIGERISEAIIECPERPLLVTTLPKRFTAFHARTFYSYERKSFMISLNALKA
ncbi:uncharacterized protein [Diadema setosum]|uniref:uncharacterized protein n=1 Tax=Diadema setosum TaxID=31175 RepID=UPI003B3BB7F4